MRRVGGEEQQGVLLARRELAVHERERVRMRAALVLPRGDHLTRTERGARAATREDGKRALGEGDGVRAGVRASGRTCDALSRTNSFGCIMSCGQSRS